MTTKRDIQRLRRYALRFAWAADRLSLPTAPKNELLGPATFDVSQAISSLYAAETAIENQIERLTDEVP